MSSPASPFDEQCMQRALEIAARGQGAVEPNPMVGCVLARDGEILGEGWHERFGGPHAEVQALEAVRRSGRSAHGADMYVTLEPCRHFGKTPPCVQAIIAAGIRRVVVAQADPFPEMAGRGIEELRQANLVVETGLCEVQARWLNRPYLKLIETGLPWVIAKWAMTLDGKLASISGHSQWISNEKSRAIAHALRRRVDGILIGIGTALADDPLLTARPPGDRVACRIVLDSGGRLPLDGQLAKTASLAPVLVVLGPHAQQANAAALKACGCEVLRLKDETANDRLLSLMQELGRRKMTNLLVEGGEHVLGQCFDLDLVDEVCVFIGPKIVGGAAAPSPVGGQGRPTMDQAWRLENPNIEVHDGDVVLRARIRRDGVTRLH